MTLIATITPIESEENIIENKILRNYARKCVHHGLLNEEYFKNGHSPFHGDLMYHQMFNTNNEIERNIYNNLSMAWKSQAKEAHIYIDFGLTEEMLDRIEILKELGIKIKYCSLNENNILVKDALIELNKDSSFIYRLSLMDSISNIESKINRGNLLSKDYNPEYIYEAKTIRFPEKDLSESLNHFNKFKTIILESPFAGDVKNNVEYAKCLIHDLAYKGYAPSASHLLYTQMLDDTKDFDRKLGIDKGLDYAHNRDSIIGLDRGMSTGMKYGYQRAENEGRKVTFYSLSNDNEVQKLISKVRDLKDASEYVEDAKSKNKTLFDLTGYVFETDLSKKILSNKNKNKLT